MTATAVPQPAVPAPDRIRSIQTLRAVAATLVVLFHLGLLGKGYTGVDLFFVISGFIMGMIGTRDAPGGFVMRRFLRIAPLYWAVTLVMCLLSLVPGLMRNFDFTAAELAMSLLFIPYVGAEGQIWPLVIPGWTLNFEMAFYLLFAAGLAARRPRAITAAVLLVLVLAGQLWPGSDPRYRVYTDPLLIEFAAGLLIARYHDRLSSGLSLALFAAGVAAFAAMLLTAVAVDEGLGRLFLAGLPAAAIVVGAVGIERARRWPALPVAEYAGDISYSLYLTHGLTLALIAKLVPAGPLEIVLGLAASFAVAAAAYHGFERPVTKHLNMAWRRWRERRRSLGSIGAATDIAA